MGLLDDAKSSVSKWFEEQVAKNKAFKAAGGMVKSNPAMTRSMGLLPATGLLEQEGDAAARANATYGALRKEYGPLGLRPGDFVPFASGGLAIDDARLAAAKGNYGQAAGSLAGVIPVGRLASNAIRGITRGRSAGDIGGVLNVTKEQFLGDPKITSNKNASDLVPKELVPTRSMQAEPFKNGMTAKYSPSGATVYDADGKVVASYNYGDTLVVGKDSRKQGIGEELVYQWRTRFPDAPPAKERTKASQALQEKVWDRITKERPDLVGIQGGLLGSSTDSRALNQFEYPQQAALDTAQRNAALSVGKADIDVSYRGSHSAPSAEFGAPLNDMTRGMYPDDFYSQNGLRYYGSGSDGEKEAFAIAQKVRGKPDAMVTAYRAVPKGAQSELNAGDWIATSKAYAKQHGESVLNGDYDIISQKVPAKHIYTNADSISEYGYDPTGLGLTGQSGLLNPEITKATNRGLYRTMLDDEEDKPSFPYGLIGK